MIETDINYPITRLFETCIKKSIPIGVFPIEEDWQDVGNIEELIVARGDN